MEKLLNLLKLVTIRDTMKNIISIEKIYHQPVDKKFSEFLRKEMTDDNISQLVEEGTLLLEKRKGECLKEIEKFLGDDPEYKGRYFIDDIFSDRIN